MKNESSNPPIASHKPQAASRKPHYDFIIVGQGLAGTLLSYTLQQEGKKALVIDKLWGNASRVAPGMFNPVSGRRLTLSWRAQEFLQAAEFIYTKLEKCLDVSFYFPKPVLRLFSAEDDFEINKNKAQTGENQHYLKHFLKDVYMRGLKKEPNFSCEILHAGYINTGIFLDAWRKKLISENLLLEENFDYNSLIHCEEGIIYKNISAGKIIFCEGFRAVENPYFSWLPFNLAKGDVLTISAPELQEEFIISKNIYIVPLGNALFRVGATYKWQTLDISPSAGGREELETALQKIIAVPYSVVAHESGIRPATKQRRPFLGMHPQYKNIGIFNGLGTKGVLLAPLLSQQLANYILHNIPLLKEVDISEFWSF